MNGSLKLFGAAVDATDDSRMIQFKKASARAYRMEIPVPNLDPYEALSPMLYAMPHEIDPFGKLTIASWLQPIPEEPHDAISTIFMERSFEG